MECQGASARETKIIRPRLLAVAQDDVISMDRIRRAKYIPFWQRPLEDILCS